MSIPVSTITLSQNEASGNAIQVNIGQITCDGANVQELMRLFDRLTFQQTLEQGNDAINEELTGHMGDLTLLESSAGEQDSNTPEDYLRAVCKKCFYELRGFDEVFLSCLCRYSRKNRPCVIECLGQSSAQKDALQSWLTDPELVMLCAYGRLNTGPSNWTSEMALEVLRMAHSVVRRTESLSLAVLYHFCGETGSGVVSTPEIIVQDLISQLIGSRPERFVRRACQQHRLSEARFAEARTRLDKLWEILSDCLSISGIQSLLIIINNIDELIPRTRCNETNMNSFRRLLEKLSTPNFQREDFFKVMIASQSAEIPRHFPIQSVEPTRIITLKVSVPPVWNRMAPNPKSIRAPIADDSTDPSDSPSESASLEEDEEGAGMWWKNSTQQLNDNEFGIADTRDDLWSTRAEDKTGAPQKRVLSLAETDSDCFFSDESLEDNSEDSGLE